MDGSALRGFSVSGPVTVAGALAGPVLIVGVDGTTAGVGGTGAGVAGTDGTGATVGGITTGGTVDGMGTGRGLGGTVRTGGGTVTGGGLGGIVWVTAGPVCAGPGVDDGAGTGPAPPVAGRTVLCGAGPPVAGALVATGTRLTGGPAYPGITAAMELRATVGVRGAVLAATGCPAAAGAGGIRAATPNTRPAPAHGAAQHAIPYKTRNRQVLTPGTRCTRARFRL